MQQNKMPKATDEKATNTAFLLMFPALLTTILAVIFAPYWAAIIAGGLSIYQFLMLKKFIEDYYKIKA